MSFNPTSEQQQAVELAMNPQHSKVKMIAYAGAGKTSTITLIAKALSHLKGIYLAFNKAIVEEAKGKMPSNVTVSTFHRLAYHSVDKSITNKLNNGETLTINNYAKWIGVNPDTVNNTLFNITGKIRNGDESFVVGVTTNDIFKIVRKTLVLYMSSDLEYMEESHVELAIEDVLDIIIDEDTLRYFINEGNVRVLTQKLWSDYISPNGHFKIPHNVYLKLYALQSPTIDFDFILFDESQDTDQLMLSILKKQDTKIIFVGDPYQQIYEWRGAVNAMTKFQGVETFLTQSFRFGQEIADIANKFLTFLSAPKPLIGARENGKIDREDKLPKDIDAVLCRTNAGVVSMTLDYSLKFKDKKVYLELNTNLDDFLNLIKAIDDFKRDAKAKTAHSLLRYFNSYEELKDYCETAPDDQEISSTFRLYEAHGYTTLVTVIDRVKRNTNCHDILVTTVHKSKGREWDVVLLGKDMEKNTVTGVVDGIKGEYVVMNRSDARLYYVAVTRAKNKLYASYIDSMLKYPLVFREQIKLSDDEQEKSKIIEEDSSKNTIIVDIFKKFLT